MDNPLVLEKITTFLSGSDLKKVCLVNRQWAKICTRVMKQRKSIHTLITQLTLPDVMDYYRQNQSEKFNESMILDWRVKNPNASSSLGSIKNENDLFTFFERFGSFVKNLIWVGGGELGDVFTSFRNSSGTLDFKPPPGAARAMCTLYLLRQLPQLESLTFDSGEIPLIPTCCEFCQPIHSPLLWLGLISPANFSILRFGPESWLSSHDIEFLTLRGLRIKEFSFLGKQIGWKSGEVLGNLLNSWSKTLEILKLKGTPRIKLGAMAALKEFSMDRIRLEDPMPLSQQFPSLQKLSVGFDKDFDWDAFVHPEMTTHFNLTFLEISESCTKFSKVRLLEKCQNLRKF